MAHRLVRLKDAFCARYRAGALARETAYDPGLVFTLALSVALVMLFWCAGCVAWRPLGLGLVAVAGVFLSADWVLRGRHIHRRNRDRRRRRDGRCTACGYSLRGNVSRVCPECGTPAAGPGAEMCPRPDDLAG